MPELPEVETIRKGLNKVIVGKTITDFESRDMKVVRFEPEKIIKKKVESIGRRAKILIFNLSDNKSLLIHLKMTGQLIWEENGEKKKHILRRKRVAGGHPNEAWGEELPCKHTRAIFRFDDKSELFFNDLRRFGYMKLVRSDEADKIPETKKIGPEIDSEQFNAKYLRSRAEKMPRKKIKSFLMDQEVIAGVGNIYSDEALFYAKILPTRLAKDLSDQDWENLIKSTKKAIELGIKYGGSSEETYVNAFGEQGTMSDHSKVYRKFGQPCPTCGTKIGREKIGGRSAHFCPKCQV